METLGAFLLRSGVLTKDTLAAALDRQVVYGGWLDTAVLELGLLDEATMADYLSQWAGYPVCARGWLEAADPAAIAAVPEALAVSHVVVPFALSPEGVWVASPAPVEVDSLAQLGAAAGRPVLPHVATEFRLRAMLRRHHGVALDPRFQELASFLAAGELTPLPSPVLNTETTVTSVSTGSGLVMEQSGGFGGEVILPAVASAPPPPVETPVEEQLPAAIDFAEALAHLAASTDRDAIVRVTAAYALQTFPFVAFLGVLRGQAVVWRARAHSGEQPTDPDALKGITIPLDEPSPLRTVVETRAPSLGAPGSRRGVSLSERLGRGTPRAVLLLPILVGGRVVGVLYSDHGQWAIRTQQASEVMAFIARVGPAFENLIRERRARTLGSTTTTKPPEPRPPVDPMLVANAAVNALAESTARAPGPDGWVVDEPAHAGRAALEPAPPPSPDGEAWVAHSPGEAPEPASEPPPSNNLEAWIAESPAEAPEPAREPPPPVAIEAPEPPPPLVEETATDDTSAPVLAEEPVAPPTLESVYDEAAGVATDVAVEPQAALPVAAQGLDDVEIREEDLAVTDEERHATGVGPAVAPPADWSSPPPIVHIQEAPVVEEQPLPAEITTDAKALAAAALARLQAGLDDDDEDEDDESAQKETKLGADLTWSAAMEDALGRKEAAGDADGSFRTDDSWQNSLSRAVEQTGAMQEPPPPQVVPHPDDDDDEPEEPKAGEEVVVFADMEHTDDANASAFAQALTDTIESGKQGGEVIEAGYRPFANEGDDEEEETGEPPGWEAVVFEAAQQVEQQKKAGAAPPPTPVEEPVSAEALSPETVEIVEESTAAPPARSTPPPLPKRVVEPQEPALIDPPKVWVEALTSGVPDRVAAAERKVLELGETAAPALIAAFPGRMAFDPFGPDANVPEPAGLSPLMDVLSRMGPAGVNVAIAHLDSRFPAHRFFATFLLARIYEPRSIPYLLRRLHDDEPRIRKLAADALAAYVAEPAFEQVLRHLRTRISSVVPEGRKRAIHFLGRFRDVGSIPSLINALRGKETEIVHEAAGALHSITLQSYGTSEKKWAGWWEKNKQRSRIEWLIDALKDSDVEVRARAGSELSQLTRDTFGFKADAPRKDRDFAIRKWERWWTDERRKLMADGQQPP